jgi:hypothetical protein
MTLEELVEMLDQYAAKLQVVRHQSPASNELFEALDDLRHLARLFAQSDTRIDYPARAREEVERWRSLETDVRQAGLDGSDYAAARDAVHELLDRFAMTSPPEDGHLGFLRIVRDRFRFLMTEYGFGVASETPASIELSSGDVYVSLACAGDAAGSFHFGPAGDRRTCFWLGDLLFLYGDERYRMFPEELHLATPAEVDRWFSRVAEILKRYGHDVLTNQRDIFRRLADAQRQRDLEYARRMAELHS